MDLPDWLYPSMPREKAEREDKPPKDSLLRALDPPRPGYQAVLRGGVKPRALKEEIPEVVGGFGDMVAGTLRGAVKAGLGAPGDIERLGRAGLGVLGVQTGDPFFRSTRDWDAALPPVREGVAPSPYESIGEYIPTPAVLPKV